MPCRNPKILVIRSPSGFEYLKFVPCGTCYDCRCSARGEMVLRMDREMKDPYNFNHWFITLSYDDEHLHTVFDEVTQRRVCNYYKNFPSSHRRYDFSLLEKSDLSEFLHELQSIFRVEYCNSIDNGNYHFTDTEENVHIRYYCTGEYGHISHRAHYHGVIMFPRTIHFFDVYNLLARIWDKGNFDLQAIDTQGACNYVAKHQVKDCKGSDFQQKVAPIFALQSVYGGGIGRILKNDEIMKRYYLDSLVTNDKSKCYYETFGGSKVYKVSIPRFLIKTWHPQRFSDEELTNSQDLNFINLFKFIFENLENNFYISGEKLAEFQALRHQFKILNVDRSFQSDFIKNESELKTLRQSLTKICLPLLLEDMKKEDEYIQHSINKRLEKLTKRDTQESDL